MRRQVGTQPPRRAASVLSSTMLVKPVFQPPAAGTSNQPWVANVLSALDSVFRATQMDGGADQDTFVQRLYMLAGMSCVWGLGAVAGNDEGPKSFNDRGSRPRVDDCVYGAFPERTPELVPENRAWLDYAWSPRGSWRRWCDASPQSVRMFAYAPAGQASCLAAETSETVRPCVLSQMGPKAGRQSVLRGSHNSTTSLCLVEATDEAAHAVMIALCARACALEPQLAVHGVLMWSKSGVWLPHPDHTHNGDR